jgi:hypothetical protein
MYRWIINQELLVNIPPNITRLIQLYTEPSAMQESWLNIARTMITFTRTVHVVKLTRKFNQEL